MVSASGNTQVVHNYLVAVDGSEASDLAFTVAMDGLYRAGIDNFNVATITDAKKENLPFNFKPEYIEDKYLSKIYAMANTGRGHYHAREKDHVNNKSTKEQLYDLAQELKTSVLVCGNHGRKGPKEGTTYLGSTVKHMAMSGTMPIIIIKDLKTRREEKGKAYRFAVCVDSSRHSEKTLRTVCSLMQNKDKLMTITVLQNGISKNKVEE